MGELVFFGIFCVMMLCAIAVTYVKESIDLVQKRRRWDREKFLENHLHYAEDKNGKVVKIK